MAGPFRIHMLDVGDRKYGDCTLIEAADKTILIDGAHRGDYYPRSGFQSIPDQLGAILGTSRPWQISLLIVTHAHNDHLGCLPEMVENRDIDVEYALATDERLGFGYLDDDDDARRDLPADVARLVAALREENWVGAWDRTAFEEFLEDAATVEDRYTDMLSQLSDSGTEIYRHGVNNLSGLTGAFSDVGLKILGPTRNQVRICAEQMRSSTHDAIEVVKGFQSDAAGAFDEILAYQSLTGLGADAEDASRAGAAVNCQSILVRLQLEGCKALITGDMQFSHPQFSELTDYMTRLRRAVADDGPFDFFRIPHHGSYNSFNRSFLEQLGETHILGISAGRGDPSHPSAGLLRLLKGRQDELTWGRTDRNRGVTVDLKPESVELEVTEGWLNDYRPNVVDALSVPTEVRASETVEVVTRVPNVRTRVTVTIDVDPSGAGAGVRPALSGDAPPLQIAGGRQLPPLLFVTSRDGLARNIGAGATDHLLEAIRDTGQLVLDTLPAGMTDADQAVPIVRSTLQRDDCQTLRGVVLLGGYDVVSSETIDALDDDLRQTLERTHSDRDGDDFIVWSDAIYGDRDGDDDPELPVSRIPDARSASLMYAAIQATRPPSGAGTHRFGVRNSARPYANGVFNLLPGQDSLLVSAPAVSTQISPQTVGRAGCVYLMLHGARHNAAKFWGEGANPASPVGFAVGNTPGTISAVALTGCCWGALPVDTTALEFLANNPIGRRAVNESIALSFLQAGALAFVGCTGSHYSPTIPPYGYFGGPMHRHFWQRYLQGIAPAEALFRAKARYLAGMPHGQDSSKALAIEMKIYHQFTCLGLGW